MRKTPWFVLISFLSLAWAQDTITHKSDHRDQVMPEVRAIDFTLGSDTEILSGGPWLQTYSIVDDNSSLIPHVPYDSVTGSSEAILPFASAKVNDVILQPDESAEQQGTQLIYYFPRMENYLITQYSIKGGAQVPTTDVLIEFFRGESAGDILPENKFFEATIPPGDWPSQGVEAAYDAITYSSGDFVGRTQIPFSKDQATIVKFTGSTTFSLKVNISQTLPWYKADLYTITARVALDQYSTRTPFFLIEPENLPELTPLVQNVLRPMRNLKIDSSHGNPGIMDFELLSDSAYVYQGLESAWYRGVTSVSAISNVSNCETSWGVVIKNSTTIDTVLNASREFDLTNEGSIVILTNGFLNTGDTIIPVVVAPTKSCPDFTITGFNKHVIKIN